MRRLGGRVGTLTTLLGLLELRLGLDQFVEAHDLDRETSVHFVGWAFVPCVPSPLPAVQSRLSDTGYDSLILGVGLPRWPLVGLVPGEDTVGDCLGLIRAEVAEDGVTDVVGGGALEIEQRQPLSRPPMAWSW